MDPVTMMAIGSIAAPVIGGLMGNMAASKDKAAQKAAMQRAINELNKLGAPPDMSKALVLKEFERQGIYTPELEQDLNDSFAEVQMVQDSPDARNTLVSNMAREEEVSKVGSTAAGRAALARIASESARSSKSARDTLLNKFAAMGQGGGGQSFAAQLQSTQDAENQAAMQGLEVAANEEAQRSASRGALAQMASGLRGQDIGLSQANTSARNERDRFLAENSIGRQTRNVGAVQEADKLRLSEQQRIADANVAMQNAEKARQADAGRQYFQDKQSLAQAKASALTGQAQQAAQQAQNTAASYAGIGSAVGTGLGAFAQKKKEP